MKTASAKQKGRRLAQAVADRLLSWAPDLQPGDITVTPSGVTGADLHLSPAALSVYPLSFECKNTERLDIWAAITQAQSHLFDMVPVVDEKGKTKREPVQKRFHVPVLAFTRNRAGRIYVALDLDDFLRLTR